MIRSAGILLYRVTGSNVEVLLGHMGGPLWASKDAGAWSIPKGVIDARDSDELAAATREFREEMGHPVPAGPRLDLGVFRQNSKKEVHVWAVEGDLDPATCRSNTFSMEWPPRSGQRQEFPEIDRAEWLPFEVAIDKVVAGQRAVLDALWSRLTAKI